MASIALKPVYNARIPEMAASRSSFAGVLHVLILMLTLVSASAASQWQAPEAQLARKIAAVTGPGAVAFNLENRSSLGPAEVKEIQSGLLSELTAMGVQTVRPDQAAATVDVTLSENLQSYVWVAEIRQGDGEATVVMISVPRMTAAELDRPVSPMTVLKALLWSDDQRILDIALVSGNPQHMIVLEAEGVVLYAMQSGHWQQQQLLSIAHERPWPRDLRGRLILTKDHLFDVYLPGVFCRSTVISPLGLDCRESDDPWPLASQPALSGFFAPARNFFTGVLSPGIGKQTAVPAFYSAAALSREKYMLWLFVAVDGKIHLLDGMTEQTLVRPSWGSDIVSVRSGCGSGWQVFATGTADRDSDTVQAFEVPDREPEVASQPFELDGAVTALWADVDGTGAIAVSKNSGTGKYEAYRLSIVCGQ